MHVIREIKQAIIKNLFKQKVIIIYGARRVGKTTLSKQLLKDFPQSQYVNCELIQNKQVLETTNSENLRDLIGNSKIVVLDEAQSINNIGLTLKVMVDTFPEVQFIATGSSSFDLANNISEPLTGRTRTYVLYPFSLNEIRQEYSKNDIKAKIENIMRFGMYPEVYNMGNDDAIEELNEISSYYLYRDVLQYQNIKKPDLVRNLLQALALQIGSEVSIHEIAKLLKQNSHTVERYIELLEKSFVIFRLPAFSRNLRKEIGKSQKIFFYDLGIRNSLIQNYNPLNLRSDIGGLWENFCVLERLKHVDNSRKFVNKYFWRTYDQKEIDYLEESGGVLNTFEFKYNNLAKAKLPKDFDRAYPDNTFSVIKPDNIFDLFSA